MLLQENYQEKTDEDLVSKTLENKENYRYLMQRYEGKLKRYIIRISGVRQEDAEDILQEVFIKTYRKLNDFDRNLKFSSWIYRIAHNETITHFRKTSRKPKTFDLEVNEIALNTLRADLDIESDLDKKNLGENMAKLINNLDNKYKEALILRYMEDKNYEEISDILKKPIGTVATLLKRAKEQFKKELIKNQSIKEYV